MNFNELPKFTKEFKKLSKKYRSLPEDLAQFKQIISSIPLGNSKHFHLVSKSESFHVMKARFFCRYLKGASLRIVYVYSEKDNFVEFIEIYAKQEKENHDQERITQYLRDL